MQKESLRSPLAHLDAPLRDTRRAAGVVSRHQLGDTPPAKTSGLPRRRPSGAARLVGLRVRSRKPEDCCGGPFPWRSLLSLRPKGPGISRR